MKVSKIFNAGKTKRRKNLTIFLGVAVVLFALLQPAWAKKPLVASSGVAIQGYDMVAYFTDGKEAKGEPEFMYKWKDALWLFKSAANRDMFAANPEKYAPRYGGHCSLSVANGKASKGSGDAWYIHNGKLYLNYSKDVRERWLRRPDRNIEKADDWWPKLLEGMS